VVVDRDTICDMGGAAELANYGEYSGAPSEQQTYDYAKTILSLMCKQINPQGAHAVIYTSLFTKDGNNYNINLHTYCVSALRMSFK